MLKLNSILSDGGLKSFMKTQSFSSSMSNINGDKHEQSYFKNGGKATLKSKTHNRLFTSIPWLLKIFWWIWYNHEKYLGGNFIQKLFLVATSKKWLYVYGSIQLKEIGYCEGNWTVRHKSLKITLLLDQTKMVVDHVVKEHIIL